MIGHALRSFHGARGQAADVEALQKQKQNQHDDCGAVRPVHGAIMTVTPGANDWGAVQAHKLSRRRGRHAPQQQV
jgi:hypothetical protein